MANLLVLDIGTSSAKAALYSPKGWLLASASQEYPVAYPRSGWAEQDPEDWWRAVCRLAPQVLGEQKEPLAAVCVSGQAPSCVAVDRAGKPIRPAILWLDRRSAALAKKLKRSLEQASVAVSGNTLDSYFGGMKWLWFRQQEPELYRQTWKILQAGSLVTLRLCGEAVIDPSQAGLCSPCFNLAERCWDAEMCARLGLDVEKLPRIAPSAQVVGQLMPKAAAETGIPVGTPVVCGAGDFACACLGAGVARAGSAAMMLGTAGNLLLPDPKKTDPRLLNTVHVTGAGLSLGGVMAGGVAHWLAGLFGEVTAELYAGLEAEAQAVPPGADGLVFLPYLMGERTPIWNPNARGVFFGLSANHGRGHLYRAALEGVAYAYRQMAEIFAETGSPLDEIIAIDGGANSGLWREIFADVLGLPICWRPNSGGTALGAAYLAALGGGEAQGWDGIQSWLGATIDSQPRPETGEVYARGFETYVKLYGQVKGLYGR
jgi:xylulokinase